LLLAHLRDRWGGVASELKQYDGMSRGELKEELLGELMDALRERQRSEELRGACIELVPGVITRVDGAYLITWRAEHCYDLLLGGVILLTFKRLREASRGARRVAVLVDTTHGVNYFAEALKDGVLRAAALYAMDRLADGPGDTDLEELVVYHYNSDPLSPESQGTPSLKIHLLDKVAVVRGGRALLNGVFAAVEERALRDGRRQLANRLREFWGGADWEGVVDAALLLSRGALAWALRVACEIKGLPSVGELGGAFYGMKLAVKERESVVSIDYEAERRPAADVVELAILADALRRMAEWARRDDASRECCEAIIGGLECAKGKVKCDARVAEGEYVCFDLERLECIARRLYTSPYLDILERELEELKRYLDKGVEGWERACEDVYVEPRTRLALAAERGRARVLASLPCGGVEPRVFYAHGGLAYGLPWFACRLSGAELICLGEPGEARGLLERQDPGGAAGQRRPQA